MPFVDADTSKAFWRKQTVSSRIWSNWCVKYAGIIIDHVYLMTFQVSTIEFSLIEVSVLHGLKQGNDVLKEIHKEMNIESVEKLLDESHEAQAYQRVWFTLKIFPPLLSHRVTGN